MSTLLNYTGLPGMNTPALSTENVFLWGPDTWYLTKGVQIDSAATDAGGSPTTDLRPGLVLGTITSSGNVTAYSPTATDGSQVASGILFAGVRMLDPLSNNAAAQLGVMIVAGPVKGASLYGIDQNARGQLFGRIICDDDLVGNRFGWRDTVAKTGNYTVTVADRDTIFTTTGNAAPLTFTLPAPQKGLKYRFLNTVGQNMLVTAPAGKLVAFNNAAATTVALQTAGNLIGSGFEIVSDEAGAKWLACPIGAGTVTVS